MSQLDASRFLANLQSLFAPNIFDGQEFFAYIDGEPNSLVIQGENILYPNSADSIYAQLSAALKNTSEHISTLQDKADEVENLCKSIPGFVTNIENLSGEFEGTPDFLFDILYFDLAELKDNIYALQGRLEKMEALFDSVDNNSDDSNNAKIIEAISSLEAKFEALQHNIEALQYNVNELSSEIHSTVVSESQFNVSD